MIKNPYNVILIGIDTLRADHLGCYGYKRPTSPAIDDFAKKSILFKNCYSQAPKTAPSFMSIMTARYPTYHGILSIADAENGGKVYVLNENITTFAEILKKNDYRTAGFTDGAQLEPVFGFSRGFDYYSTNPYDAGNYRGLGSIPEKEILYFLEQAKNESFFVFFHTYVVHNPWDSPWPYINLFSDGYDGPFKITDGFPQKIKWLQNIRVESYRSFISAMRRSKNYEDIEYYKAIYDGAIKYVDDFFARLLDYLSKLGLLEKTIIIFTSDHGQEFLEHKIFGHKQLYNELLHVPLIIYIPGFNHKVANQIVRSVDIMPTILDAIGIKLDEQLHGTSLLNTLENNLILSALAETEREGFCIQNKKYKFINHTRKFFVDELYDLENDPSEKNNIAFENLDLVEEMRWNFENELHRYPFLRPRKKTIYLMSHLINNDKYI